MMRACSWHLLCTVFFVITGANALAYGTCRGLTYL